MEQNRSGDWSEGSNLCCERDELLGRGGDFNRGLREGSFEFLSSVPGIVQKSRDMGMNGTQSLKTHRQVWADVSGTVS